MTEKIESVALKKRPDRCELKDFQNWSHEMRVVRLAVEGDPSQKQTPRDLEPLQLMNNQSPIQE